MDRAVDTGVDIALVHYPVLGKRGEVIGSAVTNLDVHDIARTARTYGIGRYYIITPYADQQELVSEIMDHWRTGHGATSNPARREAFSIVRLADSLEDVISRITERRKRRPCVVTTSARAQEKELSFACGRQRIVDGEATLLVFGTAHGLAAEALQMADYTLPAINGPTEYNHLSVRSAVAIICDRLLGVWK